MEDKIVSNVRIQDLAHNLYRISLERSKLEYRQRELNKKEARLWVSAGKERIMDEVEQAYLDLHRQYDEEE